MEKNTGSATGGPAPLLPAPQPNRAAVTGIFIMLAIFALYFARDFFMPVILAFLAALTLTPVVRFLRKHGIPEYLSATLLVFISAIALGLSGYILSGPVMQLAADAPQIGRELAERVEHLRVPFDRLLSISREIDEVTETVVDESEVLKVVVQQPGILSRTAGNLLSAATTAAIVFVLSLFLLASGPLFYEKIVQSFTKLSEKKRALTVVYDVEREISRYLFTVALINFSLGVIIAVGLWALGMPTPFLWGVLAALLNFLPYIGALMTVLSVGVISIVSFDSFSYAMVPPVYVLVCNTLEGQILTPLILGRRLELNAVAIFIAVAFWSWLWGFVGALIAVPLLVVIKVFCDHFEGLQHVGNFLAAQTTSVERPAPSAVERKEPAE